MRSCNSDRLLTAVLLLASPTLIGAQPNAGTRPQPSTMTQNHGPNRCCLFVASREISLADELEVELLVEGPAPLFVDVPMQFSASSEWRAHPERPKVRKVKDGIEVWQQLFRFEPFQAGDAVNLLTAPIKIRSGNEIQQWTVHWQPVPIRVTTSVRDPDLSFGRSVTLPEPAPPRRQPSSWWWWPLGIICLSIGGGAAVYLWRRRRPVAAIDSPLQRSLAKLDNCQGVDGAQAIAVIAQVLREYFEEQFQIPATRLGTSDTIHAIQKAQLISDDLVEVLRSILQRADLLKFAQATPSIEDYRQVAGVSKDILSAATLPVEMTVPTVTENP